MGFIRRFWLVLLIVSVIPVYVTVVAHASNIQVAVPVTCANLPALTGDTTTSAGSCDTTTARINRVAFAGTSGDLVSFGASNTPADSGLAVVSACGSVGPCATGSLSQAQIVALNATPVQVIPAQGVGTAIMVDAFNGELVAGAAQYTGGSAVAARYNGSAIVLNNCPSSVLGPTVNTFCVGGTAAGAGIPSTVAVNGAVNLAAIGSAFACASTCGTFSYWIKYHVLTGL